MANVIPTGATNLREAIASHLENTIPPIIDAARAQLGYVDHLLPYPASYREYDPLTISEYPGIGSYVTRTSNWRRVGINDHAEEVYEARYAVRIFVWVRTPQTPAGDWVAPTYDTTLRLRDDMMALMRSVLLQTPSLGTSGTVYLDESTLSEDFLDAIKANDQSPRWMVGGIINCEIKVEESNYLPALATVNDVVVEAGPIQEETP